MNISCKIAEDLLPLYLDNSCSEDSRAALEEHLKDCPSCRMKLNRMQSAITDEIHPEQSAQNWQTTQKRLDFIVSGWVCSLPLFPSSRLLSLHWVI